MYYTINSTLSGHKSTATEIHLSHSLNGVTYIESYHNTRAVYICAQWIPLFNLTILIVKTIKPESNEAITILTASVHKSYPDLLMMEI